MDIHAVGECVYSVSDRRPRRDWIVYMEEQTAPNNIDIFDHENFL